MGSPSAVLLPVALENRPVQVRVKVSEERIDKRDGKEQGHEPVQDDRQPHREAENVAQEIKDVGGPGVHSVEHERMVRWGATRPHK
jgi:hypothetical protein